MHSLLKTTLASVVATGLAVASLPAYAQTNGKFPSKPIRLVTGEAASQNDIVTRLVASRLSDSLGQPVVVENRSGAGGTVPAAAVAKAAPDGHTLLLLSAQFAIGAALRTDLPYDPLNDFAGVTRIGFSTQVLVVPTALGVKSVKELITYARERPGQILLGSGGAGTGMHMDGERFRVAAGIKVTHVGF